MKKFKVALVAFLAITLTLNLVAGCSSPTAPTPVVTPPVLAGPQPSPGAQLISDWPCCSVYQLGGGASGRPINPHSSGMIEVLISTNQPMLVQLRLRNVVVKEAETTTGKTLVPIQLDSMVDSVWFDVSSKATGTATWEAKVYLVQ